MQKSKNNSLILKQLVFVIESKSQMLIRMQTLIRKFNTTLVTCFFLLKFENKFFFRFYKNYILFEKLNKKLLN